MYRYDKIRIYWIRHGFSIANMYKKLGKKYQQSTTLDPHLTNYARWYSILAGNKLVEQIGKKKISCVYSSYMKRATETAVWMFWEAGCRQFYQLPYISEHNNAIVDLVGPYLRLGDDNRIDQNNSSVYVPTYINMKQTRTQRGKPSRNLSHKRTLSQYDNGKRTRSRYSSGKRTRSQWGSGKRTRGQRGIMNRKRIKTQDNTSIEISRFSDVSETDKELPDWNAFQQFMMNHCNKLQPSFTDDDNVPVFIIVSHSHFLKHNINCIENIANNQCYKVDYTFDEQQKTLIEETNSKTFDLHEKRCELNCDEINVEREKDTKSNVPHPLLIQSFSETTIQPIQTYKVQKVITMSYPNMG